MKSFGKILDELGFNPESSMETQKAFFKHMAQMADSKTLKSQEKQKTSKPVGTQLEFDLNFTNTKDKKVS